MARLCFDVFTNSAEDSDSDEAEWDEALRIAESHRRGSSSRALCEECGKPLRHRAKLPPCAALLKCGGNRDCERCEDQILPGEMHFFCRDCASHVCKACGPGVFISRSYDYYDSFTHDLHMESVPSRVVHERKARVKTSGGRTRGLQLSDSGARNLNFAGLAAQDLAYQVVANAARLCEEVAKEPEVLDQDWDDEDLLPQLLGVDWADVPARLELLARAARDVLASQPSLLEVNALPCKIFGDIHGQLRDLLLLFHAFGQPASPDCPSTVFNGDFVDRGRHQLEVIALLFALKIVHPNKVFLNRGNHEDHHMNARYGFHKACESLGKEQGAYVYQAFEDAFQFLPLATLIGGKILALHGGIGDGKWDLDELRSVRRPLSHDDLQMPENVWLWNILWSDPIEDDQLGAKVFGVHGSPRSKLAVKFGWNVTQAFCARNGVDLVVRSHQSKKEGLGFDVMHHESLIRVFSARDYERNDNDGAVLFVDKAEDEASHDLLRVRAQVLGAIGKE